METKKVRLNAEAKYSDLAEYRFSLEFYVFKERRVYIAYCPSLDISTSGKDFDDAVANFRVRFRIHVDWCVEHGTLLEDLIAHGWTKKKTTISPPSFDYLIQNKDVKKLLGGRKAYGKVVIPEKIALPA